MTTKCNDLIELIILLIYALISFGKNIKIFVRHALESYIRLSRRQNGNSHINNEIVLSLYLGFIMYIYINVINNI